MRLTTKPQTSQTFLNEASQGWEAFNDATCNTESTDKQLDEAINNLRSITTDSLKKQRIIVSLKDWLSSFIDVSQPIYCHTKRSQIPMTSPASNVPLTPCSPEDLDQIANDLLSDEDNEEEFLDVLVLPDKRKNFPYRKGNIIAVNSSSVLPLENINKKESCTVLRSVKNIPSTSYKTGTPLPKFPLPTNNFKRVDTPYPTTNVITTPTPSPTRSLPPSPTSSTITYESNAGLTSPGTSTSSSPEVSLKNRFPRRLPRIDTSNTVTTGTSVESPTSSVSDSSEFVE